MDEETSPAPMDPDRQFATPVYSIGPDGTQFGASATLTLHYDEGDLGGLPEDEILIYTNDGSGWSPLVTTVNEADNEATAEIDHLSDYCATIPYGEPAEGVYAILEVTRTVNFLGILDYTDMITARFDTVIDPCAVHHSLHPDSVYCNEYKLEWDPLISAYLDDSPVPEFLTPGETYAFEVFGNADVPDLTEDIVLPAVTPYVTNIAHNDILSLDGFTVEWTDTDGGFAYLTLSRDNLEEVVAVETGNDGEYIFTAQALEGLSPGTYALSLIRHNREMIDATGYDPNSFVQAGSLNVTLIMLTDDTGSIGPGGGTLPLGDDGFLTILPGALATTVDFTAEVNATPTPAPDGWAFMTPVYTVEPTGTTFALDATLHFDYDEADLNGNDEETIVIFTDTGSGWTQLTSEVIGFMDAVEAGIDHLSDFAAMVEVTQVAEGVYCELTVMRVPSAIYDAEDVEARFDAVVDPEPVTPLNAAGVDFNALPLEWDDYEMQYNLILNPLEPLTLGDSYTFVVGADADVPALTQEVTYISHDPYITSPATGYPPPVVSTTGFDVDWARGDGGMVWLEIYDIDEELVFSTETDNDGSYSVTAGDLAGAPGGYMTIELSCVTTGPIVATGYDPNSFWKTFSYSFVLVDLQ